MELCKFEFDNRIFTIKKWNGEKLSSIIAIDTETTFVPFTETPDCATIQAYDGKNTIYYVSIDHWNFFFNTNKESHMVFHNFPFDADVLCKVVINKDYFHTKIEQETIWDTSILWRLYHLATIGYVPPMQQWSLKYISKRLLNIDIIKDETRENFGQFLNTPVENIPSNFLEYGAIDVICTYKCYMNLKIKVQGTGSTTNLSHQIQLAGSLALNRVYKRGIGFDVESRNKFITEIDSKLNPLKERLSTYGYVVGQKGNKEMWNLAIDYLEITLPKNDDGTYSMKIEDLKPYERRHEFIADFIQYSALKQASDFVRPLSTDRVHPRYDSIKNTGRTGCSKPNFQNIPRLGGIREMYKAKEGYTFVITDYAAIELATLAQVTYNKYGNSVMRDRINDGEDLHKYYASVLYNKDVKDVTKAERQSAKAANFGFPGGLGIETFKEFATGYDLDIDDNEAREMKRAWFSAFPEMVQYMKEEEQSTWTITGRKRANASYCAGKNTPFQGLAADGAKIALYNMDLEGINVVGFVHDEIISEVPLDQVNEYKEKQEKIMIDSMRIVCPDVKVAVESEISERYKI